MARHEPMQLPKREEYLDADISEEREGGESASLFPLRPGRQAEGGEPRIQEPKNARMRLLHPRMKALEPEPDRQEARPDYRKANIELLPHFEEMLDYLVYHYKGIGVRKTKGELVRDALRLLWIEYQQIPEGEWRHGLPTLRSED